MTHAVHKVTSFEVVGPHRVKVSFADGLTRTIDFRPVLKGELYGPLRDDSYFRQVRLDPEVHTLVWPNGADFDPATLHDWPDVVEGFTKQADGWTEDYPYGFRTGDAAPPGAYTAANSGAAHRQIIRCWAIAGKFVDSSAACRPSALFER